eukprot:1786282-Prymnesium_polylepis.1
MVDVDEQGYLRHDSSSSEGSGSGSDVSELSNDDMDAIGTAISVHIQKLLKPHRISRDAIVVRWIESGSVIICMELELPYALKLLDLRERGYPGLDELRILSCVLGEYRPPYRSSDSKAPLPVALPKAVGKQPAAEMSGAAALDAIKD